MSSNAPTVLCHCTRCHPGTSRIPRTSRAHLKSDQSELAQLENLGIIGPTTSFLKDCIKRTRQALDDLECSNHEGQRKSPSPPSPEPVYQYQLSTQISPPTPETSTPTPESDQDQNFESPEIVLEAILPRAMEGDPVEDGMDVDDASPPDTQTLESGGTAYWYDNFDEDDFDEDEIVTTNGDTLSFDECNNNDGEGLELNLDDFPEEEILDSGREEEEEQDKEDREDIDPGGILQSEVPFFNKPACVTALQAELKSGYTVHPKPTAPFKLRDLTPSQRLSLRHYFAWRKSNGTVRAYNLHRAVLESATKIEVLSLYRVRLLAQEIAKLRPRKVDMCIRSCIAYTGEYKDLNSCPWKNPKTGVVCGEPRYKQTPASSTKLIARAQVTVLPVVPTIEAMFANAETARHMRYRDTCLKEALKLAAAASNPDSIARFSDFPNGQIHQFHHQSMQLFTEPRDVALALSSDGAQLTMKKQSNTWLLIIMFLNLPPEFRYQARNIMINFATPGPNSPGDIESFMRPLFEELAGLGEGIWIWDAIDSSYFFCRAYATIFNGDMLGSAKVSGMAGHAAKHGDRFSLLPGARSSLERGAKSQYYPLAPPQNAKYNPDRPPSFTTTQSIPLRRQEDYWKTISKLSNSTLSAKDRKALVRETGISRMALATASPAFTHPSFFPLDPFHLFYENCIPFFWDTWTTGSSPSEPFHLTTRKRQKFGELVAAGMHTLPPSFCGPIRDPHLKRQSQYKAYEWMALAHWYILPIGLELGLNANMLSVFSQFISIVEFSMTVAPRSQQDLDKLQTEVMAFLTNYERLYVGADPEKIYRCRLCVFQMYHVPTHIRWFGSIRMGSQAPVERSIGESGHKIHSKKEPFANLSNIIVETEVIRIVVDYYPDLGHHDRFTAKSSSSNSSASRPLVQPLSPSHAPASHLETLAKYVRAHSTHTTGDHQISVELFGKARLQDGTRLRSRVSEQLSSPARCYRWFEGVEPNGKRRFGESLGFYSFRLGGTTKHVAVFVPLLNVQQPFPTVVQGQWPAHANAETLAVVELQHIKNIVGLWESPLSRNVYVLRKHPGLLILTPEECGIDDELDNPHYEGNEDLD